MEYSLSQKTRLAFTITFTFVIISGITMNIAVLLVFIRNKALRQHIANIFIITLAIIDLLNLMIVMPFSLTSLGEGYWYFGTTVCKLNAFFDTLFGLASVLTLVVISLDRWIAVMKPLHYRAKMTTGRAVQMISFVWFQSTVFSVVPLFGDWYVFNTRYYSCTFQSEYGSKSYLAYLCIMFLMNIIISMIIMLVTYFFIFKVARSHSRRIACAVVQIFNAPPLRQKIRNEGFRQREVRTAIKISFVIGAFLFCHVPYSILRMLEIGHSASSGVFLPVTLTTSAKWIAFSKSSVNPFVYSLLQKRFRRALIELFVKRKQTRRTFSECTTTQRTGPSLSVSTLVSKSKLVAVSPIKEGKQSSEEAIGMNPPSNNSESDSGNT